VTAENTPVGTTSGTRIEKKEHYWYTSTPRDTLAPYLWSCSVKTCVWLRAKERRSAPPHGP